MRAEDTERRENEWLNVSQALPLLHPIPSQVLPVMFAMLHLLGGVWGVFCQEGGWKLWNSNQLIVRCLGWNFTLDPS